jgi:hypothetical protein
VPQRRFFATETGSEPKAARLQFFVFLSEKSGKSHLQVGQTAL